MNLKDKPLICIVMGSISDEPIAKKAIGFLQEKQIPHSVHVASAHRTPDLLDEIMAEANKSVEVYIGVAGMAAILSGVIASSNPDKVVIGLPVKSNDVFPDSLYSTLMSPPGVPVATVGPDQGKNAAILACQVLATKHPEVGEMLKENFAVAAAKVRNDNATIEERYRY